MFAVLAVLSSVFADCPQDPVKECFTQNEFDEAFAEARKQFESMEKMLSEGANATGIALTKSDAAFSHFSTHEIDADAFEANRLAVIRSMALKSIKTKKDYTAGQLKICFNVTKISTSSFCPVQTADCSFDDTRCVITMLFVSL